MIKVPDVVKKLLLHSDTAQLAAAEGILNVSAFARKIQPQVEDLTMKEVSLGTITTALYRLLDRYTFKNFKPNVVLSQLSIHPKVVALTYEKTASNLQKLSPVMAQLGTLESSFSTLTQGPEEITAIVSQTASQTLLQEVGVPKTVYDNLVAISVRFPNHYLEVPNTMYALLASLATKRINVMEIVSTLTSLTFVVYETEMNRTLESLKPHLKP